MPHLGPTYDDDPFFLIVRVLSDLEDLYVSHLDRLNPCPKCLAEKGRRCVGPSGNGVTTHRARRDLVPRLPRWTALLGTDPEPTAYGAEVRRLADRLRKIDSAVTALRTLERVLCP